MQLSEPDSDRESHFESLASHQVPAHSHGHVWKRAWLGPACLLVLVLPAGLQSWPWTVSVTVIIPSRVMTAHFPGLPAWALPLLQASLSLPGWVQLALASSHTCRGRRGCCTAAAAAAAGRRLEFQGDRQTPNLTWIPSRSDTVPNLFGHRPGLGLWKSQWWELFQTGLEVLRLLPRHRSLLRVNLLFFEESAWEASSDGRALA